MRLAFRKAKGSRIFIKVILLVIPVSIFVKGAVNFLPAYMAQARNLPPNMANFLYIVFMALIIPGKALSGGTLDRKGVRWTLLVITALVLVGFSVFTQVPGLWALVLGIFVAAPARGGIYTVMHAHLLD